jgi:hypothetical protein
MLGAASDADGGESARLLPPPSPRAPSRRAAASSPPPSTRQRVAAVRSRARALCAWLSKRTALSYDDLHIRPHEAEALTALRDELAAGGRRAARLRARAALGLLGRRGAGRLAQP